MIDIGSMASVATSLKTASDIAKAMMDLRDAQAIQTKVIELQREIMTAQSSALAAQAAQFSLVERVRQLEKEIADLKGFGAEQEAYELETIGPGALAYVRKADAQPAKPPHWLCAKCFDDHRKSILQVFGKLGVNSIYSCQTCGTKLQVPVRVTPESHAAARLATQVATTPVACPYCRGKTKLVSELPDPHLGPAGVMEHTLECLSCRNSITRRYTEDEGYS